MTLTARPYLRLIQQSVSGDGVAFESITPDYIYRAIKGNVSFLMYDTDVGLNSSASAKIAQSKAAAYDALRNAGLPAVEHLYVPRPDAKFTSTDPYATASAYFESRPNGVVVKPDNGSMGRHVYRAGTPDELRSTLERLFALELNVAMSPYYRTGSEFRVVTLSGAPRIWLEKRRTDSWKHNLVAGAISSDVDERLKPTLGDLASAASAALGLDFCSVDVLETEDGLKIIEVNDKVMLDEYCKHDPDRRGAVADMYRDALLLRFRRSASE